MNALENWYCSTSFWRWMTRARLLPWLLSDLELGAHLLEIGAGAGAATPEFRRRVPRVTSLEFDPIATARLAQKNGIGAGVVRGDATVLPFADSTFSSAAAILVLHHLRSGELQNRTFAEVHRVLQPGGHFFGMEIPDGRLNRFIHFKSTFVPVQPATLPTRLAAAGFVGITLDQRPGGFLFRASRGKHP